MQDDCIFCTRTNRVIDTVLEGQSAEEKLARHMPEYGPDLVIMDFEDAWKKHEDAFKSEPKEITKDEYWYALEVLPPVGWKGHSGAESFKMCERLTGSITAIYVQIGARYFVFNDDIRTPHDKCVDRVVSSDAFKAASAIPASN